MKRILIMVLLCVSLMLVGCSYLSELQASSNENVDAPVAGSEEAEGTEIPPVETEEVMNESVEEVVAESEGCTDDNECAYNENCINSQCRTVDSLYDTDCENKCNFNSVVVSTSDGEEYTLSRGKGSYTAAGALAWTLLTGPDYCPGDEDVLIPIKIEKMNYGEIVNKQVVTVQKGQVSEQITHPNIDSLAFTVTVTDLVEECS